MSPEALRETPSATRAGSTAGPYHCFSSGPINAELTAVSPSFFNATVKCNVLPAHRMSFVQSNSIICNCAVTGSADQ